MSWLFTSGGQTTGTSASASVLPMKIQGLFPSGLTGLICLLSKGLSRVFSSITVQKHQFFGAQACLIVQLTHPYMTTGKTIALTRRTFVGKVLGTFKTIACVFLTLGGTSCHPGRSKSTWFHFILQASGRQGPHWRDCACPSSGDLPFWLWNQQ